ncbi:MAG: hypothetical protein WCA30_04410, partial [Dermatophilaceae bacterium]
MARTAGRENGRRFLSVPAAAAALALVVTLLAAHPAHADAGLIVSSTSRYVVDAEGERVTGAITMTLRNVAPDETTDDGSVRFFFYDAYGIPLPAETQDVRAVSGGDELVVERLPIEGQSGFRLFQIQFPDLLFGDSRTIELSFTLEGQPPRSEDPTRIGPGYATFSVFGPGDPGSNTVEVVVPDDLTVDSTSDSFTEAPGSDGTTVYTSREDNLAPGFAATMSVRSSEVGEGRAVTVGGVPLVLVPYPNDPEWADFIEERADVGLPVLVGLVGQEWPGEIDRIRQDSGSQVRGFEGWYSTREREIVLGEALDDGVLFHELAHAWVNTSTIEDRWLSEGLAELLAEETAERTDGTFTRPEEVDATDEAAVPLQTWDESPGFRGTDGDAWAYPASYQVVTALVAGLEDEALPELLADVVTATSPWDLPGRRTLSGGALRTTTFLDLLAAHETPTVADGSAQSLYVNWVLTDEDAARLVDRAEATDAYTSFAAGGPWGPPLAIRASMAQWDYPGALALMVERSELPAAAAAVQELSERTGTELPERIRSGYEDADSEQELNAAAAAVATATDALRRYEEARAAVDADRGPFGRLGAAVLRLEATADAAQQN